MCLRYSRKLCRQYCYVESSFLGELKISWSVSLPLALALRECVCVCGELNESNINKFKMLHGMALVLNTTAL